MVEDRWREIESVFHSARARKPEERRAYVESTCGDDDELRREVESLLANADGADGFMETEIDGAAEFHAPSVPLGEQIGPYVVLEFLRAGGMGEVYKARDTRLERSIAIKFLPYALAADTVALGRFQREARAASALNHPRICTIHDVGEHLGRPYLVMELLEGESLRERLTAGPLPLPLLIDFAMQICDALAVAHAKGIVHRDIKPANLFVTANGQIKILDFGLAKLLSEPGNALQHGSPTTAAADEFTVTTPGSAAGTVSYMSPEQVRGEPVDARSDLFSLGVTLYQLATGALPFRAETPRLVQEAILNRAPVPPRGSNPAIPTALQGIVLKALQKEPSQRYASAGEMLADLRRVSHVPNLRRRWLIAGAAALLVLGAVAAGARFGWFAAVPGVAELTPLQITANPPEDPVMMASLSPDGQTIAYEDFAGIHLRRIDTRETRLIAPPPGYCFR